MSLYNYYFDGSITGATDPNSNWTNDANAFDNSTATAATQTATGANNSTAYLEAKGTNAPTTGSAIKTVRARVYGSVGASTIPRVNAEIVTAGRVQTLGTVSAISANPSPYIILDMPTAGWTWGILSQLETRVWTSGGTWTAGSINYVEIEVVTSGTLPNAEPLSISGGVIMRPHLFSPGLAR